SSERYSWSPLMSTMCLPLPGPSLPLSTTGGSAAASGSARAEPRAATAANRRSFMASGGGGGRGGGGGGGGYAAGETGGGVGRREFLLHAGAAALTPHHLLGECRDAAGGGLGAHPAGVDVRDQVAVGVGVPGPRAVGEVRREALGGRQPGPLADEQHHHRG